MLKRTKQQPKKRNKKSQFIIVGFFLILVGVGMVNTKIISIYFQVKKEGELIDDFYEEQKSVTEEFPTEVAEKNSRNKKEIKSNYIAILKIPKINLEKGLCSKESYCNNVNQNIEILKGSDMPNVELGNVILASHSGSGTNSYFKNLHKLLKGDEINIYYGGNEYKYKVANQYDIEKNGKVNIIRNLNKSTLTLITCIHNTEKQIVFICERVW